MDALLDLGGWANLSAGALVALIVVSILRGWLVPRRVLRDRMEDKDSAILGLRQERDDWRAASRAKDATIGELSSLLNEASESGRVATAIMAAIPKAAER